MKKILLFIILTVSINYSHAITYSAPCEDVEVWKVSTYCSIEGIEVTSENHCKLSTSSQITKIYDGSCRVYPEVTKVKQDQIYLAFENLFLPTKNDDSIEGLDTRENLYLVITRYIERQFAKEYAKGVNKANLQKMANMHYAMGLLTYDRHFKFRK